VVWACTAALSELLLVWPVILRTLISPRFPVVTSWIGMLRLAPTIIATVATVTIVTVFRKGKTTEGQ
jgi:hypothetical protein